VGDGAEEDKIIQNYKRETGSEMEVATGDKESEEFAERVRGELKKA
jgi:hypothetical protein